MTRRHVLERSQVVPRPRAEVFAFFADPRNLEALTPSFLRFRIETTGAIPMVPGTLIDYRLSLLGIPFRWRTRIDAFEPGVRFVDTQLRGPYRRWEHTHGFGDAPDGATRVTDRVVYELPLGLLGDVAHAVLVRRALRRIFDFRSERIEALLTSGAPGGRSAPGTAPGA
jgi:ligand-binding SRPBCC domain-containing protein